MRAKSWHRMGLHAKNDLQAASIHDARVAGLKYVTAREVGITRRRAGRGFVYRSSAGRAISDKATLERIQQLAIPPAWESVWICASERGHLQATGRDARGRTQYRYHAEYRAARDFNKFNHVISFGAVLPRIRRTVSRDLSRPNLPKRKLLALVVSLLDSTCFRVGNSEYARQNDSYGLTTLKDRHVEIRGKEIHFHFRAKSGVEQDFSMSNRKLANLLKETRGVRGSDLFQYLDEGGVRHPVNSVDINAYLQTVSGETITAKDFRTWHGTVQMLMELANAGPATSPTDAKKRLATAVKATAEKLGNRPATCRGYYIHPEVIESYMSKKLFRQLEASGSARTPHAFEAALLKLVKKVHRPTVGKSGD